MKVRWPFVVVLGVACAAYAGSRWWSRQPVALTATAPAHSARSFAPGAGGPASLADSGVAVGCTQRADAPARGAVHQVGTRAFHVWGPAAPSQPLPVAVLLHGWKSNGAEFQRWFRFEDQTQDAAYVVYPDSAPSGMWDVTGTRDLDLLERVLDETAKAYCIDRARVLVFGFSFGAKMANHVGCKRPDLARAIVAGAGSWVDADPHCGGELPVLVLHRTKDPSELVDWGHDAARRWARVQGCNAAETPSPLGLGCARYAGCRAPGSVDWCEDTWFDPAWPHDWNHTIRDEYRALAWSWFAALP